MSWWEYVPAAISAIGAISNYNSGSNQNDTSAADKYYNATEAYKVAELNIATRTAITQANISALAATNAITDQAKYLSTVYNVDLINATVAYNDSLFDQQIDSVWEAAGLDLKALQIERAKERGSIEAQQASSGVVMGQDSAADVVINQETMEALDAFVIQHNADLKVREVQNAKTRSEWEGYTQVQKLLYEGRLNSIANQASTLMQGLSMATETSLHNVADRTSAKYQFNASILDAGRSTDNNDSLLNSNLWSGLFSAIGQAAQTYSENE